MEYPDETFDGRAIVISEQASIPKQYSDNWSRVLISIEDVTEQRRAEAALRGNEERYREIFHDSPAALWEEDWSAVKARLDELTATGISDWPGYLSTHRETLAELFRLAKIVEISQAAADLYGADSPTELVDASLDPLENSEELDAFGKTLLAFLDGQLTTEVEYTDTTHDDRSILIRECATIPARYESNWFRVLYSIEDVTEQRSTEAALRASESKYREIFDESPAAIWVDDWSEVKTRLDELAASGIADWPAYFERTPEALLELDQLVEPSRSVRRREGFTARHR